MESGHANDPLRRANRGMDRRIKLGLALLWPRGPFGRYRGIPRVVVVLWIMSAGWWHGAVSSAAEQHRPFREVSFETSDGGHVVGNLYGDGDHGVVLAHGAVFNKESWDEVARHLSESGLTVLAIDFRGYGKSKTGRQPGALHLDILGAIAFLKTRDIERVSLVGGSMGGGAAARAAAECKPDEIDRVVLLAAVPIESPQRIHGRKLFIVSKRDGLRSRVRQQYSEATEPKELVELDGSAHAQHLFKTREADRLLTLITDWLTSR